eukprot:2632919-Rhodomonas_salina.1
MGGDEGYCDRVGGSGRGYGKYSRESDVGCVSYGRGCCVPDRVWDRVWDRDMRGSDVGCAYGVYCVSYRVWDRAWDRDMRGSDVGCAYGV